MKIILKNFLRNKFCNLTIASIRHFIPNAKIYCLCQYKDTIEEYNVLEELNLPLLNIFYAKSKYTNLGSSVANQYNNLFFTEGYNQIFEKFKDSQEPLLMLAEDHFFTNGKTLEELRGTDCDVAYAHWNQGANGSILFVHPNATRQFFPIPEQYTTIEHSLMDTFIKKFPQHRIHRLTTRNEIDYKGDGLYSNDYNEIKQHIAQAGILK